MHNVMQISTNGYLSMGGNLPYDALPNFPLPNSDSIVAPFAADIDTTQAGSVQYTHLTSDSSHSQDLNTVTLFINSQTNNYDFSGYELMIVEWDAVPLHSESSVSGTFFTLLGRDVMQCIISHIANNTCDIIWSVD